MWGGISLKTSATRAPIVVVATDCVGRIASELGDAPISQGSGGVGVAGWAHGVPERKLSLNKEVVSEQGAAAPRRVLRESACPASATC